jgi:hypothetical protein
MDRIRLSVAETHKDRVTSSQVGASKAKCHFSHLVQQSFFWFKNKLYRDGQTASTCTCVLDEGVGVGAGGVEIWRA